MIITQTRLSGQGPTGGIHGAFQLRETIPKVLVLTSSVLVIFLIKIGQVSVSCIIRNLGPEKNNRGKEKVDGPLMKMDKLLRPDDDYVKPE